MLYDDKTSIRRMWPNLGQFGISARAARASSCTSMVIRCIVFYLCQTCHQSNFRLSQVCFLSKFDPKRWMDIIISGNHKIEKLVSWAARRARPFAALYSSPVYIYIAKFVNYMFSVLGFVYFALRIANRSTFLIMFVVIAHHPPNFILNEHLQNWSSRWHELKRWQRPQLFRGD